MKLCSLIQDLAEKGITEINSLSDAQQTQLAGLVILEEGIITGDHDVLIADPYGQQILTILGKFLIEPCAIKKQHLGQQLLHLLAANAVAFYRQRLEDDIDAQREYLQRHADSAEEKVENDHDYVYAALPANLSLAVGRE